MRIAARADRFKERATGCRPYDADRRFAMLTFEPRISTFKVDYLPIRMM